MRLLLITITLYLLLPPQAATAQLFGGGNRDYEEENTAWVYPPWKHTWGHVRATQTHLTLYTLGKARFSNPQGLACVRLEAMDNPEKRGDDDEVTVYGVNSGENSIIYNPSMSSIAFYGYDESGEERLNVPWDVAALPNGLVFVTDSGNKRVVKLRNVAGKLRYEGAFGTDPPALLELPRGIDVTGGGKVVVADAGRDRVVVFDTSGAYVGAFGGLDRPVGLAAVDKKSEFTRPPAEYIVVSDSGGARLQKFSLTGSRLFSVDIARETGLENPCVGHVETDLYNHVVATDSANNRLLKFDRKLGLLALWGQDGAGRTRFEGPTGIAIWRRFGQTFVAEQGGAHYLWVGSDFTHLPRLRVEEDQDIYLELGLTERSHLVLELLDGNGEVVRDHHAYLYSGEEELHWPLNRERVSGVRHSDLARRYAPIPPLPGGEYLLRLTLKAAYSSTKSASKVLETEVVLPDVAFEEE